jgi:hypothetical protein
MKEYYYYFRNAEKKPYVTVCLLVNEQNSDGEWSRGVAICSAQDNPCKKTGRKIAYQRAIHAMMIESNNLPISERFIHPYWHNNGNHFNLTFPYLTYKAAYKPNPINEIETKILKDNNVW